MGLMVFSVKHLTRLQSACQWGWDLIWKLWEWNHFQVIPGWFYAGSFLFRSVFITTLYAKSCFHFIDKETLQPLNNFLKASMLVSLIGAPNFCLKIRKMHVECENQILIKSLVSFINNNVVIGKLIRDIVHHINLASILPLIFSQPFGDFDFSA